METRVPKAHHLYAVGGQPVEHLEEEQGREQDDEGAVELLPEDGEGEERFCDGIPRALVQALSEGEIEGG